MSTKQKIVDKLLVKMTNNLKISKSDKLPYKHLPRGILECQKITQLNVWSQSIFELYLVILDVKEIINTKRLQ